MSSMCEEDQVDWDNFSLEEEGSNPQAIAQDVDMVDAPVDMSLVQHETNSSASDTEASTRACGVASESALKQPIPGPDDDPDSDGDTRMRDESLSVKEAIDGLWKRAQCEYTVQTAMNKRAFERSICVVAFVWKMGWKLILDGSRPFKLTAFVLAHAEYHRNLADSCQSWPAMVAGLSDYVVKAEDALGLIDLNGQTVGNWLLTESFLEDLFKRMVPDTTIFQCWMDLRAKIRKADIDFWCAFGEKQSVLPKLAAATQINAENFEFLELPHIAHAHLFISEEGLLIIHGKDLGQHSRFSLHYRGSNETLRDPPKMFKAFQESGNFNDFRGVNKKLALPKQENIFMHDRAGTNGRMPEDFHIEASKKCYAAAFSIDGKKFQDRGKLPIGKSSEHVMLGIFPSVQFPRLTFDATAPSGKRIKLGIIPEMCDTYEARVTLWDPVGTVEHVPEREYQWPHLGVKFGKHASKPGYLIRVIEFIAVLRPGRNVSMMGDSEGCVDDLDGEQREIAQKLVNARRISVIAPCDDTRVSATLEFLKVVNMSARAHCGKPATLWQYYPKSNDNFTVSQLIRQFSDDLKIGKFPPVPHYLHATVEQKISSTDDQVKSRQFGKLQFQPDRLSMEPLVLAGVLSEVRARQFDALTALAQKELCLNAELTWEHHVSTAQNGATARWMSVSARITMPPDAIFKSLPEPGQQVTLCAEMPDIRSSESFRQTKRAKSSRQDERTITRDEYRILATVHTTDLRNYRIEAKFSLHSPSAEYAWLDRQHPVSKAQFPMRLEYDAPDDTQESICAISRLESLLNFSRSSQPTGFSFSRRYLKCGPRFEVTIFDKEHGSRLNDQQFQLAKAFLIGDGSPTGLPQLYAQQKAVFKRLTDRMDDAFTDIQGPPGTGKTVATMRPIILVATGRKVLCSTARNSAVRATHLQTIYMLRKLFNVHPTIGRTLRIAGLHTKQDLLYHEQRSIFKNPPELFPGTDPHDQLFGGFQGSPEEYSLDRLVYRCVKQQLRYQSVTMPTHLRKCCEAYDGLDRQLRDEGIASGGSPTPQAKESFLKRNKALGEWLLGQTNIVFGTIATAHKYVTKMDNFWKPSVIVLDEAGKLPWVQAVKLFGGSCKPDVVILVGDKLQIGTHSSASIAGYQEFEWFAKASISDLLSGDDSIVLDENRRNPAECWEYSRHLYGQQANVRSMVDVSEHELVTVLSNSIANDHDEQIFSGALRNVDLSTRNQFCFHVDGHDQLQHYESGINRGGENRTGKYTISDGSEKRFKTKSNPPYNNDPVNMAAATAVDHLVNIVGISPSRMMVQVLYKFHESGILAALEKYLNPDQMAELVVGIASTTQGSEREIVFTPIGTCGCSEIAVSKATLNVAMTRAEVFHFVFMNMRLHGEMNRGKHGQLAVLWNLRQHFYERHQDIEWQQPSSHSVDNRPAQRPRTNGTSSVSAIPISGIDLIQSQKSSKRSRELSPVFPLVDYDFSIQSSSSQGLAVFSTPARPMQSSEDEGLPTTSTQALSTEYAMPPFSSHYRPSDDDVSASAASSAIEAPVTTAPRKIATAKSLVEKYPTKFKLVKRAPKN